MLHFQITTFFKLSEKSVREEAKLFILTSAAVQDVRWLIVAVRDEEPASVEQCCRFSRSFVNLCEAIFCLYVEDGGHEKA